MLPKQHSCAFLRVQRLAVAPYVRFRFKLETVNIGDISLPFMATPDTGAPGQKPGVGGLRPRLSD
jgi:hypothetical protein